jgi:hypothetical protein
MGPAGMFRILGRLRRAAAAQPRAGHLAAAARRTAAAALLNEAGEGDESALRCMRARVQACVQKTGAARWDVHAPARGCAAGLSASASGNDLLTLLHAPAHTRIVQQGCDDVA